MEHALRRVACVVMAAGIVCGTIASSAAQSNPSQLYSGSFALVIGVSRYDSPKWPALPRVMTEIESVTSALQAQGFNVTKLAGRVDSRLLKDNIDKFIADHGYQPKARLVVFFAGHGYTRRDGQTGYVVPADAPSPSDDEQGFLGKAIPMGQFNAWARQMEALHVLFVFDSCFSGSIFVSRGAAAPDSRPLTRILAEPVREFLTAGSANESVPGTSVFTPMLVRGLQGDADTNHDGLITGTELGSWIQSQPAVFDVHETPQFGKVRDPDLDRGDIVFASPSTAGAIPGAPAPTPTNARPADPRAGFFGAYSARGWAETDGSVLDWELRVSRFGIAVRAWRQVDNRAPQAQEMSCDWIGGEADEFQCYLIPGRPHVTPRRPEDDREVNLTTWQIVLHPEGVMIRELTGPRPTVTLFRRMTGGGADRR